jgi:hypothetical protein
MDKAVLLGPFVGELYWEFARFAPMVPFMKNKKYKNQNVKYIILTRPERFDLYGKYADTLVPLKIPGDYENKQPNCFRLNNLLHSEYQNYAKKFKQVYSKKYNIIEHIYPDVSKAQFVNKNQYSRTKMIFDYQPRKENYDLVEEYLPEHKPIVVLAPRYRDGFKRNWNGWTDFYNKIFKDEVLMDKFTFVICGKKDEYVPDPEHRFHDMNDIELGDGSSLIGLLLVIMEKAFFTFGSQSAIPNISLMYKKDVLCFGCQRYLHTKTYNIRNTPITFFDDKQYKIEVNKVYRELKKLLMKKEKSKNE